MPSGPRRKGYSNGRIGTRPRAPRRRPDRLERARACSSASDLRRPVRAGARQRARASCAAAGGSVADIADDDVYVTDIAGVPPAARKELGADLARADRHALSRRWRSSRSRALVELEAVVEIQAVAYICEMTPMIPKPTTFALELDRRRRDDHARSPRRASTRSRSRSTASSPRRSSSSTATTRCARS